LRDRPADAEKRFMTEIVQRITDPVVAARRILEAAALCNAPSAEAIGIVQTVAGYGSIPLTRDYGEDRVKDRPGVAHEAGMHVGSGGAGAPYKDVVAAINDLIRADGNSAR
jgi:hypothetical protein